MRGIKFGCLVVAIITVAVSVIAMTLLVWPLLAGVSAVLCGGAVVGGQVADHFAQRGPTR